MTREEEINKVAQYRANGTIDDRLAEMYFIAGAEWADENPMKELWDAKKLYEIVHAVINSDTIVQYLIFDDENIDFDSELFFEDLRKAMED